jgi:ribose 5-phosphate isomerase A
MDKKRAAAESAVELIEDGMTVGLGTGSTANFAIEALGRRVADGLMIVGVPTSKGTEALARKQGIKLIDLNDAEIVHMTIDGADEVDPCLNLIKGMGGALLREKIVAFASAEEVIVVDDSKLVETLGTKSPLPVEVLRFGHLKTKDTLQGLGCTARLKGGERPFVTDNGNLIYECRFPRIEDPQLLESELHHIPGVVECGLFIDLATRVIIGKQDGVEVREKD